MRLCFVLYACWSIACSPRYAAAPQAAQNATVPLVYDPQEYAPGKRFPLAMIEVLIDGKRTRAIVDTGAEVTVVSHLIGRGMAEKPSQNIKGKDSANKAVAMRNLAPFFVTLVGLKEIRLQNAVSSELPAVFSKLGVGMILSPQALASTDRVVVIDFPNATFGLTREQRSKPTDVELSICDYGDDGIRPRALLGNGRVNGMAARLLLDTGASTTHLQASSVAAKLILQARGAKAITTTGAGGESAAREFADVPVHLGAAQAVTALTISDDDATTVEADSDKKPCQHDGAVGLDLLKSCRITVGLQFVEMQCRNSPVH
jgi:hypothetical protein